MAGGSIRKPASMLAIVGCVVAGIALLLRPGVSAEPRDANLEVLGERLLRRYLSLCPHASLGLRVAVLGGDASPLVDGLARYAAAIDPAVRTAVEQWQPGERVEVYPRLKQLTLNLAVEVFMGGAPGASQARLDQVNSAFIDCVQAATALVRYPVPGGRWHRRSAGRSRELARVSNN